MAVHPLFMKINYIGIITFYTYSSIEFVQKRSSCLSDRGNVSLNYKQMFVSFVYYVLYFYIKSDFDKEPELCFPPTGAGRWGGRDIVFCSGVCVIPWEHDNF